jgi:hypothetical protein
MKFLNLVIAAIADTTSQRIRRDKFDQVDIFLPSGKRKGSADCGLFRRFSINHFM